LFFALAPNEKQKGTKTTMSDIRNDDAVQHGIDDNAHDDGKKGLELGALGGGAIGAIAGAALGPVGMLVGALIGGSVGSVASGAAVEAVDTVDNDNTVSGVGDGATLKSGGTVGGTTYGGTTPNVHAGATSSGDYERGTYVGGSDVNTAGSTYGTTGHIDDTGAGKAGLAGGALVGGTIGAAVGGPVGAIVGGTIGSLVGGATGNAGEAAAESTTGTRGTTGGNYGTTGHIDDTGAGKAGLAGGALVGGTIGAAVGGPVGAVVGGTIGSLVGGATGNAGEAAAESTTGGAYGTSNYASTTTPDVHAGTPTMNTSYEQLTSGDYNTRPYGTYEGRSVSRTDYNKMPENDRMRVQLLAEELQVDKQVRQVGEVEIGKRVVSEQVSVPVSLQREEVIIHQTNVSGGDARGAVIGEGQTITVPISEEFAQVSKTTSVAGEVEIEKRMTTEQKTISDTVRHEELDVNKGTTGRVTVEDDTKGKM